MRGRTARIMTADAALIGTICFFVTGILTFFLCSSARAQAPPTLDPLGRSGDQSPPLLEEGVPPEPPSQILPPPPPTETSSPLALDGVFVREIKITGSSVFSEAELAAIAAPYLNRELTSEDLEALRLALTLAYVNRGYVTSGAIIPDQAVTSGVVTYNIVEGRLTAIEVEGNRWFTSSYIRD